MRRVVVTALLCLFALMCAAPAQAASRNEIIRDCADGSLDGTYSPSELRDARQNLPADVAEYTNCADLLRRAELPDTPGGAGGGGTGTSGGPGTPGATAGGAPGSPGGTGGGPGGSFVPTTPEDFRALEEAQAAGRGGSVVGGRRLLPGLSASSVRNDLPDTLLVAIVVLAVAGLALAIPGVRRALPRPWPLPRLPSRRSAP